MNNKQYFELIVNDGEVKPIEIRITENEKTFSEFFSSEIDARKWVDQFPDMVEE